MAEVNGLKKNQGGTVNLDLSELAQVDQSISAGEKVEKPVLLKPVAATVIGADLKIRTGELKHNKDDVTKKYYEASFVVETKFTNPADGEEFVSKDNYNGLRAYPKINENGEPIFDANGNPVLDRFWSGDKSAFGSLLALVQKTDDSVVTYGDFFNFFIQPRDCTVKTFFTTYNNEQFSKEVIQSFI